MKLKIMHILCEGNTEHIFVQKILKPYLLEQGFTAVKSQKVTTNAKLKASGGVSKYSKIKKDIQNFRQSNPIVEHEQRIITTMIDYYKFPTDSPSYEESKKIKDPYKRIQFLEEEFKKDINDQVFVPYIQLHEIETLVFCGIEHISAFYPKTEKKCEKLIKELNEVGNPELINNSEQTSPSKRIERVLGHYDKPNLCKVVTERVGVEELRRQCKHFNEWIEKLINY
jgi:hypothetical protein